MTATSLLPPEWAPQAAVQLTWPHASGDWGSDLAAAQACMLHIAQAIGSRQPLLISCDGEAQRQHLYAQLTSAGVPAENLQLVIQPSNDVWARDHGPLTAQAQDKRVLLNFHFNGWGGKYAHDLDDALTRRLCNQGAYAQLGIDRISDIDCILEGGAIEVNGAGSLLTTSRCLLNPTRNPGYDKARYAALFTRLFGVTQVHWLEHGGLTGDDTDGHIDTLARFVRANTIVYQACADPADEHYRELQAMATELQSLRQADGSGYNLHALPWPAAQYDPSGRRLPATYANFLIINQAVLMPSYGCAADTAAQQLLAGCFPDREIVPVDCRALIRQGGSLHCVSMQIPAAATT